MNEDDNVHEEDYIGKVKKGQGNFQKGNKSKEKGKSKGADLCGLR